MVSSVVFQRLPEATAARNSRGFSGWNDRSEMRPELMAGPMVLNGIEASGWLAAPSSSAAAHSGPAIAMAARRVTRRSALTGMGDGSFLVLSPARSRCEVEQGGAEVYPAPRSSW